MTRNVLLALYVALALFMLCWPGYAMFGNSIEPYVLGLPFSLAWIVFWVFASFLALVAFYLTDPAERRESRG